MNSRERHNQQNIKNQKLARIRSKYFQEIENVVSLHYVLRVTPEDTLAHVMNLVKEGAKECEVLKESTIKNTR